MNRNTIKKLSIPITILFIAFTLFSCAKGSKTMDGRLIRSNVYKKNPHLRPFHAAIDILEQNPKTVTNLKTAVKNFGESLLIKPDFPQAYLNLGMTYEKLRKLDQAESSYRSALSMDSKNIDAIKGLTRIFMKTKRFKQGLALVDKHLKENKEDKDLLNLKVLLLIDSKQYFSALQIIRKIMETDRNDLTAINSLGLIYYRNRKFNLAELTFQNGIKLEEKSAELHNNLGLVFLKTDQVQSAIYEFKAAKEEDPDMPEPRMNLADLYLKYKNYKGAMREYALLLQIDPVNPTARTNYSVCLIAQNNYQTASRFLKSVLSIESNNSSALFNLGLLYKDNLSNPNMALKYFKRYVTLKNVSQKDKKSAYEDIKKLQKTIAAKAREKKQAKSRTITIKTQKGNKTTPKATK